LTIQKDVQFPNLSPIGSSIQDTGIAAHLVEGNRAPCPFNLLGKESGNELDLTLLAVSGGALKRCTPARRNSMLFSLRSQVCV